MAKKKASAGALLKLTFEAKHVVASKVGTVYVEIPDTTATVDLEGLAAAVIQDDVIQWDFSPPKELHTSTDLRMTGVKSVPRDEAVVRYSCCVGEWLIAGEVTHADE